MPKSTRFQTNHRFIELPEMETIIEMDEQQARFLAALEISDDGKQVLCQDCMLPQPNQQGQYLQVISI